MIWFVAGGVVALILFWPAKVLARGQYAGLVARGSVSSPFGPRGPEGIHAGIDIAAPAGTEVRAVMAGRVLDMASDGKRTNYGNTVILEHADTRLTLYAHLERFGQGVKIGNWVQAGDVIGYVGATQSPKVSGMRPHLHFEVLVKKVIWKGQVVVNPDVPPRIEPVAWLRIKGRPIRDMA